MIPLSNTFLWFDCVCWGDTPSYGDIVVGAWVTWIKRWVTWIWTMSCQHYLETQLKPSIVQQNLEKLLSRADAGMLKEQQLPLVHLPLLVTLIAPHFSGLYCWKVKYVVPAFMCEHRRGVLNLPNNMIFILFAAHLWYICCADLMCCLTMCYHCSTSAPSPGECCHCHEGVGKMSFCAGFRWFSFPPVGYWHLMDMVQLLFLPLFLPYWETLSATQWTKPT